MPQEPRPSSPRSSYLPIFSGAAPWGRATVCVWVSETAGVLTVLSDCAGASVLGRVVGRRRVQAAHGFLVALLALVGGGARGAGRPRQVRAQRLLRRADH